MRALMSGPRRFVIVDTRNGLGNRLRVMASAMGVAAAERRPLLVVWEPDAHCNASLRALFKEPYPFALLEEAMYLPPTPTAEPPGLGKPLVPSGAYQLFNYLNEPGGEKGALVRVDPSRHLYFRSSFLMNHPHGMWSDEAQFMLSHITKALVPVDAVASKLVTKRWMIGIHVRTVYDYPLADAQADSMSKRAGQADGDGKADTTNKRAAQEYGEVAALEVARWRSGCNYTNFIPRMTFLLSKRPLKFYLAADTESAYTGLMREFPGAIIRTERSCTDPEHCDARDLDSQITALVDMLNLAHTGRILGSGYSSYSEVAAWLGSTRKLIPGIDGQERPGPFKSVPIELAGRDFGEKISRAGNTSAVPAVQNMTMTQQRRIPDLTPSQTCPTWEDVMNTPKPLRWLLWEDQRPVTAISEPMERVEFAAARCRSGCHLMGCNNGRNAPCCVRRATAQYKTGCAEMPYGCASPRRQRWRKRSVVIDLYAMPVIHGKSPDCPTTSDVWNTPRRERWKLWDDPNCQDKCRLYHHVKKRVKLAPSCVRRVKVEFPYNNDCNLLFYGCTPQRTRIGELESPPPRPPAVPPPPPWTLITLEPSLRCPNREDVMNTPAMQRWDLWNDEKCEDGCRVEKCNLGKTAPCCVKRMQAVYPKRRRGARPCEFFAHGCFDVASRRVKAGYIVSDVASKKLVERNDKLRIIRRVLKATLIVLPFIVPAIQAARAVFRCFSRRRHATPPSYTGRQMVMDVFFLIVGLALVAHSLTAISGSLDLRIDEAVPAVPMRNSLATAMQDLVETNAVAQSSRPSKVHGGVHPLETFLEDEPEPERSIGLDDVVDFSNRSLSLFQIMRSHPSEWTAPRWLPMYESPAELRPPAVPWHVQREKEKTGAGLLFFAYGATTTLNHFLLEAEHAARSFRMHNPNISIAVVTNNATVDSFVFSIHISPRSDLLFAGGNVNDGQMRADKVPRQWLTRLYYMAHSPYDVTWALDSNVISCTPGAAQHFLDVAMRTRLWGFHILHASQNINESSVMYPHNFNIAYIWSLETSELLRDWLLLTMSAGIASDDQKSLHFAELRQHYHVRYSWDDAPLRVGRIRSEFGAAFYDVHRYEARQTKRTDAARLTPILSGRVHLLHSTNSSLCHVFNENAQGGEFSNHELSGERQILMQTTGRGPPKPNETKGPAIYGYRPIHTQAQCQSVLGRPYRACLLGTPGQVPIAFDSGGRFAMRTNVEDFVAYANSSRCASAFQGTCM